MTDFKQNIRSLYRHYSTYVAFIASSAAGYWLHLDPAAQDALLGSYPSLKLVAPTVSFVAFMIARGLPQKTETSQ